MTEIMYHIEKLQDKLNKMVTKSDNDKDLYELSTELDRWIVKYYQQDS